MCGGPQSCVRSPSIIVVSTCCPASRHSPKNAVRVSARMWSNGSGNCAVASAAHARASPPEDPVRLFFIGGSFRYGCGDHRPSIGRRKEPPLFFSTDQFNSRWDIPQNESLPTDDPEAQRAGQLSLAVTDEFQTGTQQGIVLCRLRGLPSSRFRFWIPAMRGAAR